MSDEINNGETAEEIVRQLVMREGNAEPETQRHANGKPQKPTPKSPRVRNVILARVTNAVGLKLRALRNRVSDVVRAYNPAPRHVALMVLLGITLMMPMLIVILAVVFALLLVITYLSLGPERSGEVVAAWFARFERRDPHKAEDVRARAERGSARLAKGLEFLPKRWVSGIYLPDFTVSDQQPDAMAGDPFDRLARDTTEL